MIQNKTQSKNNKAYFFLAPALIIMLVGLFYPIGYSIYTSFFDWRLGMPLSDAKFTAFDNYIWLLNDPDILNAFRVTFKFSMIVVIIELVLGVALALLLDKKIKGISILRTIFIMPMMIAPIVVGLMWQYLYNAQFGIFNKMLVFLGLEPIGWLSSDKWALFSVILSDIWQWTPFIFILAIASLQSLPQSMIEAARIDGATEWQIIRFIKLPLMIPVIIIAGLLRLIDSLKIFEVIYIMTGGGPAGSTEVVSMAIYNQAFIDFELGRSAALSNLFLGSLMILSVIFFIIIKIRLHKKSARQEIHHAAS
ncbi:MAG: multiple sugar transport system permease protein [Alphaproteobacteria bacterium]|jgi:multiple sugar transport system permease protein